MSSSSSSLVTYQPIKIIGQFKFNNELKKEINIKPQQLFLTPEHYIFEFLDNYFVDNSIIRLHNITELVIRTSTEYFLVFLSFDHPNDPYEQILFYLNDHQIYPNQECKIDLNDFASLFKRIYFIHPSVFLYSQTLPLKSQIFFNINQNINNKEDEDEDEEILLTKKSKISTYIQSILSNEQKTKIICEFNLSRSHPFWTDFYFFGKRIYLDQTDWLHLFQSEYTKTRYEVQYSDDIVNAKLVPLPYSLDLKKLTGLQLIQFNILSNNNNKEDNNVFVEILKNKFYSEIFGTSITYLLEHKKKKKKSSSLIFKKLVILATPIGFGWLSIININNFS